MANCDSQGDAENGRNRSKLAILPFTVFRVRALSLSATVNKTHMSIPSVATSETPQTRDRGHVDQKSAMHPILRPASSPTPRNINPAPPRVFCPQSRVCGISLAANDHGTMCILLTVADRERARLRKMVTGKMANLLRFAPFRDKPEGQQKSLKWLRRETAQIAKPLPAKACDNSTRNCRTESSAIGAGLKCAETSRSQSPSILPAPAVGASVFFE